MKKIIMILAVLISTTSAFAGEENVTTKVLNAFKAEFNTAKEVEWTVGSNYYKAAFVYNEKHVFAFYNKEGELLGLTRYLSTDDLPLNLQNNLKKSYSKYWITDLFEVAKSEGTAYYITLEDADTKLILKASAESDWSAYQKTRKA